ncbi:IS1595 family transposase [Sphingopyxis sp. YF1]|uniref:IS1595 family transposase n=1 Tax=Sphingopyxis sp. YF1 TaxID=2482763 RepID=UPI001F602696|nr:IS1595 family transposase [Sphingopyxis sp. YF1]UNU44028.1 IS1595 family transposase [Sphingopyxis sp. YF1]
MSKAPTLRQFMDRFPTEDSCLDHLMRVRFGDRHDCGGCGKSAHFYRVAKRRSYACEYCGHQVYPTAGTPFDRTRTPLRDWFFVMFLFCTSRHGVAAKEVERQLGVTYKTAWRMCHQIREYMGSLDSDDPLGGMGETVEIDETIVGGSVSGKGNGYMGNKTVVVGMLERRGELITRVVTSRTKFAMHNLIQQHVLPGTRISTDEMGGYKDIDRKGYSHIKVNHNRGQYATKDGAGVNAIEGFWAQLKRGINGTHIHVSRQHLPKYLGEFEFRWNMRQTPHLMLDRLLVSFSR